MNRQPWVLSDNQLTLFCHVQPGAKQNKLSGLYDNCLKIQLKTAPIEGKANKALIDFLAITCEVSKSRVTIKRGLSSRRKTIVIQDLCKIPVEIIKFAKE